MTLNGHYAFCYTNHASFGAHHAHLKEDRLMISAARELYFQAHADVPESSVAMAPQTRVGSSKCNFYSLRVHISSEPLIIIIIIKSIYTRRLKTKKSLGAELRPTLL